MPRGSQSWSRRLFSEVPPAVFALAAGIIFAIGAQFQNLGLARVSSRSGAAISIVSSAVLYWLVSPWLLDGAHWSHPAVLIFAAIGLFRPSVSANLAVAGMRYLGPTLATTLSSVSPVFSVAMGVLWLGEVLNGTTALATTGIIAAVVMLAKRDVKIPTTWPLWAIGLPVAAAAVRSIGHVLSKIGMEGIPDPYFAGLVGFTVSAMVMILVQWARPEPQRIQWRRRDPYWFVLGGLTMGIALLCLNTALLRGEVVSVIPIVAASPVFTMLLSIFVFHRETLTPRIVMAVLVVVPSVIFIALNR